MRVLLALLGSDLVDGLPVFLDGLDSFVRNYAAPGKGFQNIFLGSRNESLRISVFYSQDKFSAFLFCKEVII